MTQQKQQKAKDKDMEYMRNQIEKQIKERFKIPVWRRLWDVIEAFVVFILVILAFISIIFILVTLIEHPSSLAILCATIVIIIMWWTK